MTETRPNKIDLECRFRLCSPDVAFQIIDGEAILIHFEHGAYYSARGTGCEILKLLEVGHSVREIAGELAECAGVPFPTVVGVVEDYVARVVGEGLVVSDTTREPSAKDGGKGQLEPLVLGETELVKYTDLEDLLLLDPIHDVDDAGWPPHVEGSSTANPSG